MCGRHPRDVDVASPIASSSSSSSSASTRASAVEEANARLRKRLPSREDVAAVDADDVAVSALRRLARERGLGRDLSRRTLDWAMMLGIDARAIDVEAFSAFAAAACAEERVVRADVARAGQQFEREYAGKEDLESVREDIRRALFAALNAHGSAGVHYVQGLHDVASVLAFADRRRANRDEDGGGDGVCAAILERVLLWHVRDHTRKDISGTMEMVAMLADLLRARDAELAAKLRSVPPFYAVSWFVCWFLHRVEQLEIAVRLLDAFIASHPLFPVYVGVALVESRREDIVAESKNELDVLSTMNDMRISDPQSSVDEQLEQVQALIERALRIYEENPPEKTFRFARNSAATRYPYPWHPEVKSRVRIERAPLGDDVVPYDGSRRWPICAFDNVRAAVRIHRLRKRGLYAARYDKTVGGVIITEFIQPTVIVLLFVLVLFLFNRDVGLERALVACGLAKPPSPPSTWSSYFIRRPPPPTGIRELSLRVASALVF